MNYEQDIRAARGDPERLENLYRTARRAREVPAFAVGLEACCTDDPGNVLYAAWRYRLQPAREELAAALSSTWRAAIPLSLVNGAIFALLAGPRLDLPGGMPFLFLVWAPIAGCFIIAFLAILGRQPRRRTLPAVAALLGLGIYATLWALPAGRQVYRTLMLIHLPLLAWVAVGFSLLGTRRESEGLFAVLSKSLEVLITGGIYVLAGGAFAAITFGLFGALGIRITDTVMRLVLEGGGGLIPVLAVATVYDPRLRPIEQRFEEGLGKLVPTLTRLLLPLTLVVLAIYLVAIPFNFMQPFRDRGLLIVYNVMLFAVMGLLIGATPPQVPEQPARYLGALRSGIVALAGLAVLISLYALSAVVYRTVLGGLTANRLTVIGWNAINIGLLALLLYKQVRQGAAGWIRAVQSVAVPGAIAYTLWVVFLTVAVPLLFRG